MSGARYGLGMGSQGRGSKEHCRGGLGKYESCSPLAEGGGNEN